MLENCNLTVGVSNFVLSIVEEELPKPTELWESPASAIAKMKQIRENLIEGYNSIGNELAAGNIKAPKQNEVIRELGHLKKSIFKVDQFLQNFSDIPNQQPEPQSLQDSVSDEDLDKLEVDDSLQLPNGDTITRDK